jgi:hypothetical protein
MLKTAVDLLRTELVVDPPRDVTAACFATTQYCGRCWKSMLLFNPCASWSTCHYAGGLHADDFFTFFRDEMENIRTSSSKTEPPAFSESSSPGLSSFIPATVRDHYTLLNSSISKSCDLDPLPILTAPAASVISYLGNLTHSTGVFPSQPKQTRVLPLVETPSLYPDVANSCRSISISSFISKLVERVVAKRFTSFATIFNTLPPQQSA